MSKISKLSLYNKYYARSHSFCFLELTITIVTRLTSICSKNGILQFGPTSNCTTSLISEVKIFGHDITGNKPNLEEIESLVLCHDVQFLASDLVTYQLHVTRKVSVKGLSA
jgi:hypothetical protein